MRQRKMKKMVEFERDDVYVKKWNGWDGMVYQS